jgi:hypothetical protein
MRGAQTYRFAVRGRRVDQLSELIEPTGIRNEGDQTLLTAVIIDQSQLRGVLDSIADLGLQLVGLERLGPAPPPGATRTNEP